MWVAGIPQWYILFTMKDEFSRRDFLLTLTKLLGLAGAGASLVPMVGALMPAHNIILEGIMEVDIRDLKEGELKRVLWRRQPVFILKRTKEMIKHTASIKPEELKDPAHPEDRTLREDLFVGIGICTHLGCIPRLVKDGLKGLPAGGFYCPCHGGKYDSLGRRLEGPPPENLHLLPYRIEGKRLVIGSQFFAGYTENVRKIGDLPEDG